MKIIDLFSTKETRFLWALAALFILLGLGYDSLTPIFENSDETLHYPYVQHIAAGQGLPLARPGQLWNQEGTQPPLYYAIVAATTFWLDTGNLGEHLQRNPHWLFTEVRGLLNDNQNLVLHGPMDAFPYRRAALAIHIGRWWSLFFGLVTVICTFFIGRRLFPDNLPLTLTATALTALTPQFIRVSATVSNDSLSAALASLTVLLALTVTAPRHLPAQPSPWRPGRSWLGPLLLGLLCGLALLTKLSSLSTFFLAAAILFWRFFFLGELHRRPLATLLRWLLVMGMVTAALTGWWFWRNYRLYGEWLAIETHLDLAGRGELSLAQVWALRAEVERAYWATFGWGQIRPPEWVFRLLGGFTRIGLLGLGLGLLARLGQGERRRPLPLDLSVVRLEPILFLLFWAGLNLALYVRWVTEVGSVSHTRLIFPALTAIALLLAVGWHTLLPRRLDWPLSGAVTAGFLALNLYSLFGLIGPAFTPITGAGPQTPLANQTDLTVLDSLSLTGGDVFGGLDPTAQRPSAQPGDWVAIRARWEVDAPLPKNYSLAATLLAPDGRVLAQRETYPGLGLRPTRYLSPGQSFVDLYPLRLQVPVTEPLIARAVVTLFDFESETRAGFPALDATGQAVTPVVGHLKITPDPWPVYEPTRSARVSFGQTIELIGYDLEQEEDNLQLTLYWRVVTPVEENYTLFIHLLDAQGQLIAQADAPPTHNRYPTRWWAPGETIASAHPLPETAGLAALRLGLYDPLTGQRLPITASTLPTQDNGVLIELP